MLTLLTLGKERLTALEKRRQQRKCSLKVEDPYKLGKKGYERI
jgi:hypothetical protein